MVVKERKREVMRKLSEIQEEERKRRRIHRFLTSCHSIDPKNESSS